MADNSKISRVYAFLQQQGNWVSKADINNDGFIIKAEFKDFMLDEFNWSGEESSESAKNDLINEFWKTIDTNKGGKVKGSRLNYKNALDKDELNAMAEKIEVYNALDAYKKANVKNPPEGIKKAKLWIDSVNAALETETMNYIQQGGKADGLSEYLDTKLPTIKAKTSANRYAQEYLESNEIQSLLPEGYKGEGTLQGLIDSFVQSIADSGEDITPQEIQARAKAVVQAYLATAEIDGMEADEELLSELGYYTGGELNDIQSAVVTESLKKKLAGYLNQYYSDVYTDSNKASIDAFIEAYIQDKIANASYNDFNSLKNMDVNDIVSNDEFDALISDIRTLMTAKEDLKNMVKDALTNDQKKEVIKNIFGSTTESAINKAIDALGTLEEVQALKEQIENGMGDILPDDFWSALPDQLTVTTGSSKQIQLQNYFGNYSTGDLHFSSSNANIISVDETTGLLTVNGGSVPGGGKITITVKNSEGKVLGSKSVEVVIEEGCSTILAKAENKQMDLYMVDDWNDGIVGDYNFQDLYNGDKNVIIYGKMDKRKRDWDHMKDTIKNNLTTLGKQVVSVLVTAGLDESKLTTAMNNVVSRYYEEGAIRNKNDHGTSRSDLKEHCEQYMKEHRDSTKSRIVWTVDTDARDSNVYMIHFKDFVDDILAEYQKLA